MTLITDDLAFAEDWLMHREDADAVARNGFLTEQGATWLQRRLSTQSSVTVLDLACGAGANINYLAPQFPGPQQWRLVDNDAGLLNAAECRGHSLCDAGRRSLGVLAVTRDLRVLLDDSQGLDDLLSEADLVTASALFDLVSKVWVERLVTACARHGTAALFALSIDGGWSFTADGSVSADTPDDAWVRDILAAHQRRDKGFGPALGGDAPSVLTHAFQAVGYHVLNRPSSWTLTPDRDGARLLALELIKGWAEAVLEQSPQDRGRVSAWYRRRCDDLESGRIGLLVGHQDLFATPQEHS